MMSRKYRCAQSLSYVLVYILHRVLHVLQIRVPAYVQDLLCGLDACGPDACGQGDEARNDEYVRIRRTIRNSGDTKDRGTMDHGTKDHTIPYIRTMDHSTKDRSIFHSANSTDCVRSCASCGIPSRSPIL